MKCSNCNIEIPNDSAFCQHCGSKVILKEKHDDQFKQTKIKKSNIVIVAIIVLLLASVVMNVVQIVNNQKITSKLSKSDKKISALVSENKEQSAEIKKLKNNIIDMECEISNMQWEIDDLEDMIDYY